MTRTDAESLRDSKGIPKAALWLLYLSALVVVIAGIRAASAIVVPFLLSVFFSIVFTRPLRALERRLSFPVAFSLIMIFLVLLFVSVPVMIGGSLQQVLGVLPELRQQLRGWGTNVIEKLEEWDLGIPAGNLAQAFDPSWATTMLSLFLNGLLKAFSNGIVVLIMTGFMLAETSWFSAKLEMLDQGSGESQRRLSQITNNARRYLGIKTIVSLATGVVVWLSMRLLGVEFAAVWGFLAFLLNYIPTVGSIIAGIPPVMLALVQNGLIVALAVAVCFFVVNQVFGSIIEPRLQGLGLGLSPLIVFISLIFWGWILGPVGMLLSAPLTMFLRIAFEEFPETRWLAILLAGKPEGLVRLEEKRRSELVSTS